MNCMPRYCTKRKDWKVLFEIPVFMQQVSSLHQKILLRSDSCCTAKDSTLWVTQIEGNVIEDAGVIKMDFLGLKTLTIIKNALELIKQNHGVEIDIDTIPLDDEKNI